MRPFAADLHIHTALSPCALDEMTPDAIVATAMRCGLDLIAICDHNAAESGAAVAFAAQHNSAQRPLTVLPGIEITTAEEAHILGLFAEPGAALRVARTVQDTLVVPPAKRNRPDDEWLSYAASSLPLNDVIELIKRHAGLVVASHVDRPSYSVTSQLGMVPVEAALDALEISAIGRAQARHARFAPLGFPILTSSDSHSLGEIGTARTWFNLAAPTFDELALALRRAEGRSVLALGGEEERWEDVPRV